jgi:2-polyprenyl-3-methyl-5-hydroxy-6-metoxy-1,4-benzoquinol methylase
MKAIAAAERASQLALIEQRGEAAGAALLERHGAELDEFREAVRAGIKLTMSRLDIAAAEFTGGNETVRQTLDELREYVDWLQWSLWDLPAISVALRVPPPQLVEGVASCGMVYLSMRLVDDSIDRHHRYKDRHDTLVAAAHKRRRSNQSAEVLSLLSGLLLCFHGMASLVAEGSRLSSESLTPLLASVRNTIFGVIMELSPREEWDEAFYERLIKLKNVEFWRVLYAAVDPLNRSPLLGFLEAYYTLAQKLNDVQDQVDDEQRGQPNLLAIRRMALRASADPRAQVSGEIENELGNDFWRLSEHALTLTGRERLVAEAKLGESLASARALGLFKVAEPAPVSVEAPAPAAHGLQWYSEVTDILKHFGPDALVETLCNVCGGAERKHLFQKQGFAFHRCSGCSHIYVSPRVTSDVGAAIARERDSVDEHSALMEVQKFYAGAVCSLLRARAPGARLLDVGFGRGYLLELARSFGFDSYGVETSLAQLGRLDERMGARLHEGGTTDGALPWGSFDVVIMSHVIEHLERPLEVLSHVYAALNPEGIFYVAVPDMRSAQFQVFGKHWDAITPLSHLQYFNQASLQRALEEAGFEDAERVNPLDLPQDLVPPWMRLMRQLGGSDSGELAMMARRPPA